ncbi:MAG: HAMP domain-containing sensor histidine kinase [Candidatus Sulfotelmatobacter sp.]
MRSLHQFTKNPSDYAIRSTRELGLKKSFPFWPLVLSGMVVLLTIVAVLQYRWTTEVSAASEVRIGTELESLMIKWHLDFYGEFSAICVATLGGPDSGATDTWDDFLQRYVEWKSSTLNDDSLMNIYRNPDLVEDIYIWETSQKTKPRLLRLNADKKRIETSVVPQDLETLLARLQANSANLPLALHAWESPDPSSEHAAPGNDTSGPDSSRSNTTTGWQFDENIPAIVHPVVRHNDVQPPSSRNPVDWMVVVLNPSTIQRRILPDLAKRYFGSRDGLDYKVAVIAAGKTPRTIYSSEPGFGVRDVGTVDSTMNIFGPRSESEEVHLWSAAKSSGSLRSRQWHSFPGPVWFPVIEYASRPDPWVLVLQHSNGTLQAVVDRVRRRNLAISALVLLLLAVNMGFVTVAGLRAQTFARLQMDFVASVSHELRTPLTAIFSAGENIKDGFVSGQSSLKHYGSIVINQARQLMDLVDRILLFASIRSGKDRYNIRPLEVSEILQRVRKATAGLIDEEDPYTVEEQVELNLPCVLGDLPAVYRCLENLITNAIKYSGKNRHIRISATLHELNNHKKEIWISVEDHGIGISSSELRHIFEPFYRSPKVAAAQIHGTGLGLSLATHLAEAMGGRISVVSEIGVGSIFTLHLPAADAPEPELAAVNSGREEVMPNE